MKRNKGGDAPWIHSVTQSCDLQCNSFFLKLLTKFVIITVLHCVLMSLSCWRASSKSLRNCSKRTWFCEEKQRENKGTLPMPTKRLHSNCLKEGKTVSFSLLQAANRDEFYSFSTDWPKITAEPRSGPWPPNFNWMRSAFRSRAELNVTKRGESVFKGGILWIELKHSKGWCLHNKFTCPISGFVVAACRSSRISASKELRSFFRNSSITRLVSSSWKIEPLPT